MSSHDSGFVVRQALPRERDPTFAFHLAHADEYIWPRTAQEFERLIDELLVYIVLAPDGSLRGLCYVREENGEWEFGGVYLEPVVRGRGLARVLGHSALGTAFALQRPERLIAHVHEFNEAPRKLLPALGFRVTGEKAMPPVDLAPETMRRNANGEIVGDVYEYDRSSLICTIEWLESFRPEASGATVEMPIWQEREYYASLLRSIATGEDD